MGADKVVAVRLRRPRPAAHDDAEARERLGRGPSAIETVRRSVDLMQATMRGQRSPGTIVIAPECEGVPGVGLRRFSIGRRYIEAGEAAVEAAARGGYDAVLMDVMLGGLDGLAATRRIRALAGKAGQVPVIGISGRGAAADEAAARAAGMDFYFIKPVSPGKLAQALAALSSPR